MKVKALDRGIISIKPPAPAYDVSTERFASGVVETSQGPEEIFYIVKSVISAGNEAYAEMLLSEPELESRLRVVRAFRWRAFEGDDISCGVRVMIDMAQREPEKRIRSNVRATLETAALRSHPNSMDLLAPTEFMVNALRPLLLKSLVEDVVEIMKKAPQTVRSVSMLLSDHDAEVSSSAAFALRLVSQVIDISLSIPQLSLALASEHLNTRTYSAWALDRAADQAIDMVIAIPFLIAALSDPDLIMRVTLISCLGKLASRPENKVPLREVLLMIDPDDRVGGGIRSSLLEIIS